MSCQKVYSICKLSPNSPIPSSKILLLILFSNFFPGNACKKLGNLEEAKKSYEKALTEHRTPEYRTALSETESLLKKKAEEAYIDPAISETEKQVQFYIQPSSRQPRGYGSSQIKKKSKLQLKFFVTPFFGKWKQNPKNDSFFSRPATSCSRRVISVGRWSDTVRRSRGTQAMPKSTPTGRLATQSSCHLIWHYRQVHLYETTT